MAINYYELKSKNTIGYIDKYGRFIDFSTLIGIRGHDEYHNKLSMLFLRYVNYVIDDEIHYGINNPIFGLRYCNNNTGKQYRDDLRDKLDYEYRLIKKLCEFYEIEHESKLNPSILLEKKLLEFFIQLYDNDFFSSLGKKIIVDNEEQALEYINNKYKNISEFRKYELLHDYLILSIMSYFKDILVQYLGYDSVERVGFSTILYNNIHIPLDNYVPRKIVTSCNNIHERFYNWLIMGWNVSKIPKYIWDNKKKQYIEESDLTKYYTNEKEIVLQKEIESIKKLSLSNRVNYFR